MFGLVQKAQVSPKARIPSSHVYGFLILAVGLFSWAFLSLVNLHDFGFYLPDGLATQENDFFIYCQRARFIGETGQENVFGGLNKLSPAYHGLSPYHYPELWLGHAFARIFGIPHVLSMGLLVKPLLYVCSACGLLAIYETLQGSFAPRVILLLGLLFLVSGLFASLGLFKLPSFNLSMLSYRFKMIVYYPFLIGWILMILQANYTRAFLFLSGLMISTVVVIPALLGGSMLYTLFREKNGNSNMRIPMLGIALTALAIFLFYQFAPSPEIGSSLGVSKREFFAQLNLGEILGMVLHFFQSLGTLSLVFISVLGLVFFTIQTNKLELKSLKDICIYTVAILLAGAAAFAVLKTYENSIQLYYNLAIACCNLFAILCIMKLMTQKTWRTWAYLYMGLSCINQAYLLGPKLFSHHSTAYYSSSYLAHIASLAEQGHLSEFGAVLKAEEDYFSDFSKIAFAYTGAYYLAYLPGEISCISMSDIDIPIREENHRNNLINRNSGYFYQYHESAKKQDDYQSVSHTQVDFIEAHKINFIVASKNTQVSPLLSQKVDQIIVDSLSGERFLLLKKP